MNDVADEWILAELGISREVYQELMVIIGKVPTVDEVSTLLAMWQSQGQKQGLLSWLRGQPHSMELHDYLTDNQEPESQSVREPRVKECIAIARQLFQPSPTSVSPNPNAMDLRSSGNLIYMVGDVSLYFTGSEYGRRYLHLVDNPVAMDSDDETAAYMQLILDSLAANYALFAHHRIGEGGLFGALLEVTATYGNGFEILTCREVRLDSFLFGERGVRYVVFLDEPREDFFIQKLGEARVNCCFLGRVTKNRIVVDDMDFGKVSLYR